MTTKLKVVPVPAARCDCNTCPFYIHNPAAVEPVCSGSNSDCSYCSCTRYAAPGPAPCGQCPVRCGSRHDIKAWMADIGGTVLFDDIALADSLPAHLPRFVPQVDSREVDSLDDQLGWPAYALGLRRVMSPTTGRIYPGFSEGPPLGRGRLSVLVGYGTDPHVEMFWTRRHELIPEIADMGWDLVLAPNFSIYGNYPRAEMLINMRRNLVIASEMNQAGTTAVPNVYWFRLEDLERTVQWIGDTDPPAVAINLQTFRTDSDWSDYALAGLTYLAAFTEDVPLIVTGTSRFDRLSQLSGLFGDRLFLIGQNALAFARRGAIITPSGREDREALTVDAFGHNVRFYQRIIKQEGGVPV